MTACNICKYIWKVIFVWFDEQKILRAKYIARNTGSSQEQKRYNGNNMWQEAHYWQKPKKIKICSLFSFGKKARYIS